MICLAYLLNIRHIQTYANLLISAIIHIFSVLGINYFMNYQELLEKYNLLVKENNRLTEENSRLKIKLETTQSDPNLSIRNVIVKKSISYDKAVNDPPFLETNNKFDL